MNVCCCNRKFGCIGITAIVSLIIGIVAAFLQISGMINVTPAFLWVLLGIAVVYLAVVLLATAIGNRVDGCGSCLCNTLSVLLLSIIGTVLFSIVLLGITFEAASVVGAIIVGLLLFSFASLIGNTACLVKCFADCGE